MQLGMFLEFPRPAGSNYQEAFDSSFTLVDEAEAAAPAAEEQPAQPEQQADAAPAPTEAPAESAPTESAPDDAAGPPLAPAAKRMGLPTAAWAAAVVVVAVVLILVFTGVI